MDVGVKRGGRGKEDMSVSSGVVGGGGHDC